jgi:hypothetical protein
VLRDYEQRKAFVLFLDNNLSTYRYPSTIVLTEGNLYFGFKAEKFRAKSQKVYDAIKAKIYLIGGIEVPSQEEDLATLYLAHIISRALDFAEAHAFRGKAKAVMGMTLGIPAEELEHAALRHVYVRIARTAYEIAVRIGTDPQGEKLADCLQGLMFAREQIATKDALSPPDPLAYAQWLRPELAAAMYWGVKSPTIQCDLYSCIDIGAWTTNASYFRLHSCNGSEKGGIAFYGGTCCPPGMIELLKSVSQEMGKEYTELYGQEHLLSLKQYSTHIDIFKNRYFAVWQDGFRKSYPKEKSQGAWDGKLNVMVVGGGSKVSSIKEMFYKFFPHKGWAPPKPVPDLGVPSDLYEFPSSGILARKAFDGDSTFLFVAYGLSVHSKDFPKTTLAPQVVPFKPELRTRKFMSSDDLGYEK